MITKPSSVLKGLPAEYEIDPALIAAEIEDEYFADTDNWKKVVLTYKSVVGKQIVNIVIDPQATETVGNALFPITARDQFQFERILIVDFVHDTYKIERAAIANAASLDVSFSESVSSGPIDWLFELNNQYESLNNNGGVATTINRVGTYSSLYGANLSGDFDVTYEIGTQTIDYSIGFLKADAEANFCGVNWGTVGFNYYFNSLSPTGAVQSISGLNSLSPAGPYTLRMKKVGTTMTMWINDIQVFSLTHADVALVVRPYLTIQAGATITSASISMNTELRITPSNFIQSGFYVTGNPSDGLYDGTDTGNYAYSLSPTGNFIGLDLDSPKEVKKFGVCMSNFGGLQWTPTSIRVDGRDSTGDAWTEYETFTYQRSDWQAGVRKDITLSTARTHRYFRLVILGYESTSGSSLTFSEISAYTTV